MDTLVSTDWLAAQLLAQRGSPGCVILDASSHLPAVGRDAAGEFAAGHIPGARYLDLASLVDRDSPVPAAVPTASQLATRLTQLGIGPGQRIVLYDDSAVRTAARAWFILRHYGLAEVAILDGGLGKWRAEGRALETGEAPAAPAAVPLPLTLGHLPIRRKAEILANIASAAEQLVDVRDAPRFAGEVADFRPGVASGHIPGSTNLPYERLFAADGTYLEPAALAALFAAEGIDLARPITTTCGSGVTAATLLFALHRAGKQDVALYDGSWSEWGADPATPKALGPA